MTADSSGKPTPALAELQADLLALQSRVPGLRLQRATRGTSDDAPFPITLSAVVTAPPQGSQYDVDSIKVVVRLQAPLPRPAVSIEVHSPILPERLRRAVAEDVLATYQVEAAARAGDAGGLHLDRIWADLRRRWVTLISSCPELLEAYTSSDADGRTVRRYAFVDEEEVPAGHGSATGAPDGTGAELGDRAREGASLAAAAAGLTLGEGRGAGPASLPAASTQLPAQLAADVRWAEVRYRAACQVFWGPGGRPGPGQCRPPSAGQRSLLSMLLDLTPADPDWPAGAMLHLSLSVEAAAGEDGQPSVRVSGLTCSGSTHLTGLESTALQRLVQALLLQEGGARLQSALRTLENGGGGLLRSARCIAAEVERRRAAAGGKADGGAGTADQADNPGVVDSAAGSDDSPRDSSREGGEGSGSDVEGAEAGGGPGPGKTGDRSSMQGGRPVLLRLGGLQLAGCDALEALTLIMQVACGRCGATATLALALQGREGADAEEACPGCHARLALHASPRIVHEHSNVLCRLDATRCAPRDLSLGTTVQGQCGNCTALCALRGVQVGQWNARACRACHCSVGFKFDQPEFEEQGPPGRDPAARRREAAAAGGGPKRSRAPDHILKAGQPLPSFGTCRHYCHSYRWLRFPCCGERYPCDLCHEEGVADGHPVAWAKRMVCGYCSVEQPCAPRCANCLRKLAATGHNPSGTHSRFWEGGKGERDPRRLDRRDARKYRNSKAKTASRKHMRTGQKAGTATS
uniref:CHY-type domain-containing protein n=1 Tax=Auxenochlorella protothecoides TaxID=3075 RepID=A0A1D2AC62_AUXPR